MLSTSENLIDSNYQLLADFIKCFGIAHDEDGARVVQIEHRTTVLEAYKQAKKVIHGK
jgi:hypothetical protein